MVYIEIKFSFKPHVEWFIDIFINELGEIGFESFVETESGLEAFIPERNFNELELKTLISNQSEDIRITWSKELIKDKNWNEEWEKNYFQPLMIGEDCVIRAPFHKEFPKAKYEIVIEPNMAFGTGNHETTSMMIESILAEDFKGKLVLDMGCGTGILGILASMKGAEKVTAIDISEWAVSGTEENAALNNIKNISVKLGNASSLGNEMYDLIFANIHKNILIDDMEAYANSLIPAGKILLSGFYLRDLEDIKKATSNAGLKFVSQIVKKDWVMVTVKK